jgi:hypothetical protein
MIPVEDDTLATTMVRTERVRVVLPARDRTLLLARRQALLIELGALEAYLGIERSVSTRTELKGRIAATMLAVVERQLGVRLSPSERELLRDGLATCLGPQSLNGS